MNASDSKELENCTQNVIKFVTMPAPPINIFAIAGNVTHVIDAVLIRLFAEGFRARYEVVTPPDGEYGSKLPNGTWSGMVGMIVRSEADLAMASIALTQDRCEVVQFSYPHLQSPLTFMTEKPVPLSKNMAIVYPFSPEVWIFLTICLVAVSLVFYAWMHQKKKYQTIVLRIFGSLLEQDVGFTLDAYKLRPLAISWFFSAMIITYSYKAILLSFLTIPTLGGIRDISDLTKAITANSITCFTYKGTYTTKKFSESDDDSSRALSKCLLDNEKLSGGPEEYFLPFPGKKVFIGDFLMWFDRDFLVSEDSFYNHYFGIAVSKEFCYRKYLNELIHRFNAAGLFLKYLKDVKFIVQLNMPPLGSNKPESVIKIGLEDISGPLYILIFGWLLALLTLLVEILVKRNITL